MKTWNMRFSRLTGGFLGGLLCLLMVLGSSPVSAEKSVTVTFYHTDALGSVVATSDEFGNLKWQRGYQPYGEIQLPRDSNDTDTNTNALGYTGKPRDPSGLVYLGARYYDPLAGRFMAVDPAGIDANNPHSFNRYTYANNNPYKYVDPDGKAPASLTAFMPVIIPGDIDKTIEASTAVRDGAMMGGILGTAIIAAPQVVPLITKGLIKKIIKRSAKGLIGKDFEDYLVETEGGTGSFTEGGREFDGALGNRWREAKSGKYWERWAQPGEGFNKFKSDIGHKNAIARDNNATLEVHSNTPIPSHVKDWLSKKGIPFIEH